MTNNIYLQKICDAKNLYIYGAGKYGKTAFQLLKELNLINKICSFIVTSTPRLPHIENIPIKSIDNITNEELENSFIILALAEKNLTEVISVLKKSGVNNYCCIQQLWWKDYTLGINGDLQKLIAQDNELLNKAASGMETSANKKFTATQITFYPSRNAGDTFLSWCVRQNFPDTIFDIQQVTEPVTNEFIEKINSKDFLLIGGGGLFLPDTNENSISGWEWAISREQLLKINVPIIVYSVGYNYFKGQENTQLFIDSVNNLVNKAAFVGLRNQGSIFSIKDILQEKLKNKIEYQPCTTTFLSEYYPAKHQSGTKIVGLNMAYDREERRFGMEKIQIEKQVASAIKRISQMGYKIWYVAHSSDDLRFLVRLDETGIQYEVKNLSIATPEQIIQTYEKIECMIGMRGHSQMIPFGVGCNIITLASHNKMKWFLDDTDLSDECFVDLSIDKNKIADRIFDTFYHTNINCGKEIKKIIAANKKILFLNSRENHKNIMTVIENNKKINSTFSHNESARNRKLVMRMGGGTDTPVGELAEKDIPIS